MTANSREPKWKRWLKLNRLLPTLTVLGSASAIVLSLIGVIKLSLAENIIIALIGLVAVDALSERIGFLEAFERKIDIIMSEQSLRTRKDMADLETLTDKASEVSIISVAAPSLQNAVGLLKDRIREGCKIKIVLLNPSSQSFYAWDLTRPDNDTLTKLNTTLNQLKKILLNPSLKEGLEVRLSEIFLSYSMFCVDAKKSCGSMNVEFYSYKKEIDERPHIHLIASENPYWFNYYVEEFEALWANAKVWTPEPEET